MTTGAPIESSPADAGRPIVDAAAVDELRRSFDGELVGPGEAAYETGRQVWNAMVDRRPALIARPRGTADVSSVVRFGRAHGLEIAVRGGGHSAVGHSMAHGGLTIDLSLMRGVRVDVEDKRAWVQGGCLLADLDREAQFHGLATTGGIVSHTGVAGLTLGGGYGYLARQHGLACDNLAAVEIVTADGSVIVADERRDRDLFWAVRGGGGNFGVVTAFDFRLHEVSPETLSVDIAYRLEDGRAALERLRSFAGEAAASVTCGAAVAPAPAADFVPDDLRGHPIVWLSMVALGDPDASRPLADALRTGRPPLVEFVEPMPYLELQRVSDQSQRYGMRRYWKSHFVAELSDGLFDALLDGSNGDGGTSLAGGSLWQLGGAVAAVGPDGGPFGGRDATFDYLAAASWEDPAEDDARLAAARRLADAVAPFGTGRVYVNGLENEGEARIRAAFAPGAYELLARVKARYDPDNVFHLNQNIRPAASS